MDKTDKELIDGNELKNLRTWRVAAEDVRGCDVRYDERLDGIVDDMEEVFAEQREVSSLLRELTTPQPDEQQPPAVRLLAAGPGWGSLALSALGGLFRLLLALGRSLAALGELFRIATRSFLFDNGWIKFGAIGATLISLYGFYLVIRGPGQLLAAIGDLLGR